jgi:hypothetical protein
MIEGNYVIEAPCEGCLSSRRRPGSGKPENAESCAMNVELRPADTADQLLPVAIRARSWPYPIPACRDSRSPVIAAIAAVMLFLLLDGQRRDPASDLADLDSAQASAFASPPPLVVPPESAPLPPTVVTIPLPPPPVPMPHSRAAIPPQS